MIRIIAVGKIKEEFYRLALSEYSKRLSAYTKFQIIQVEDEKCEENISEKQADRIRQKEGERILKNLKDSDYVITLEILGKSLSSEEFASKLESLAVEGHPDIAFVIGGSIGLHKIVSDRADFQLSFSKMTYPHQLMRVILAEQIYRAFKIQRGEPYHK